MLNKGKQINIRDINIQKIKLKFFINYIFHSKEIKYIF